MIRMKALCQKAVDAMDRVGIRIRTQLHDFVVIYERLITHGSIFDRKREHVND